MSTPVNVSTCCSNQETRVPSHLWRLRLTSAKNCLFCLRSEVCLGFRVTNGFGYFWVTFDHFLNECHFSRKLGLWQKLSRALNQTTITKLSLFKSLISTVVRCRPYYDLKEKQKMTMRARKRILLKFLLTKVAESFPHQGCKSHNFSVIGTNSINLQFYISNVQVTDQFNSFNQYLLCSFSNEINIGTKYYSFIPFIWCLCLR